MVVGVQQKRLPDRRRLLPDRQVRGSPMVVDHALVIALRLDLLQHGLEAANDRHIAVNPNQVLAGEAVHLLREGPIVRVDRNRLERDLPALADFGRANHEGFRHSLFFRDTGFCIKVHEFI